MKTLKTTSILALAVASIFLLSSCNKDNSTTDGEPLGGWGFDFTFTDSTGTPLFESISEFRADPSYDFDPYFTDRSGQKFKIRVYEAKEYSTINFLANKSSVGVREELDLNEDEALLWYLNLNKMRTDTLYVKNPIYGSSSAEYILLNNDTLQKNGKPLDTNSHPFYNIYYP
jgi:hypothetical protein